ncbi:MAG: phosphodiester glycosidase family protein [Eubacteriales bacterium]
MKQTIQPLKKAISLALALLLAVPSVHAVEGNLLWQSVKEIFPGFTFVKNAATTGNGEIRSYTMSVTPSSTAFPIVVQGSGSIYGGGNINKALETAKNLGYHVVGGINSDYFSLSTGVPMGIVIENGVYKSSPSEYSSILFNEKDTTILGATSIPITIENNRSGSSITTYHLNKFRTDTGGIYLYNREFADTTRTSTEGLMIRLHPTYDQLQSETGAKLSVDCTLELSVTEVVDSSFPLEIGENDFILTAADQGGYRSMLEDFQVGDTVTLNIFTSNSELRNAQWATGGGDIMISAGEITSTNTWQHTSGTAPRTAFGVKEDGTLIYYAVDGRQDISVGLTQYDLAKHLLDEGCYYAVNLDGGGSTSVAVSSLTAPYTLSAPTLANIPSDGGLRSCATYLLFADPRIPSQLMLDNKPNTTLIGSEIQLGKVGARDVNSTVLDIYPSDAEVENLRNLGILSSSTDSDGHLNYTYAPMETGTEFFYLSAPSLELEDEIAMTIVDHLTLLALRLEGKEETISEISLVAGETITLEPYALSYGTEVYVNGSSLNWSVRGLEYDSTSYGAFLSPAVYQAGNDDCTITLTAGGQTAHIAVTIKNSFDDVPSTHWAHEAIHYLSTNEIIGGLSETEFGLGKAISRGDFILMLYRAFNSPTVYSSAASLFSDVSETDYALSAISWAVENTITTGMGDGTFGRSRDISREQAFLMIYRAFAAMDIHFPTTSLAGLSQYQDQNQLTSYAMQAAAVLSYQGILTDTTDYLYPLASLSRESMAEYIYNLLLFTQLEQSSPTQLSLSSTEISLQPGQSHLLMPLLFPAGSAADLQWSVSDPSAVSIDQNGFVKNIFTGTGQPVVSVTVSTGSLSATCIIRCVPEGTDTDSPSYTLPDSSSDEDLTPSPTPDDESDTEIETETALAYTGFVVDAPGGLNVRSAPSAEGEIVTQLPEGSMINLHKYTADDWYQISCYLLIDDSLTPVQGYVMGAYIKEENITATVAVENNETTLRLRAGAGTAFDVIAQLPNGSRLTVLQTFGDWFKVETFLEGQTVTGFVASEYLNY